MVDGQPDRLPRVRRKGSWVLCVSPDCGERLGRIARAGDVVRDKYRPELYSRNEVSERFVRELEDSFLSGDPDKVRRVREYLQHRDETFFLLPGFVRRADGVWVLSARNLRRKKMGRMPLVRRPVTTAGGTTDWFPQHVPDLPATVWCPGCTRLQLVDAECIALAAATRY